MICYINSHVRCQNGKKNNNLIPFLCILDSNRCDSTIVNFDLYIILIDCFFLFFSVLSSIVHLRLFFIFSMKYICEMRLNSTYIYQIRIILELFVQIKIECRIQAYDK